MDKVKTQSEETHVINGELATLLRLLARPDALYILYRTGMGGINNSTYAIEELDITPKRYYSRLRELVDAGLVKKKDRIYRQTALGRIMYDRFLPAMGRACEAKNELNILDGLEGTAIEDKVKRVFEGELGILGLTESSKLRIIDNYESMVVDVIDLCNEAKESILMASNYLDVRVMEAVFRAVDRDVTNRLIMGKKSLSSKLQNLRMMLSLTVAKTIINFASNKVNLRDFVRFTELPYSFCIVDGHRNIIEISDTINDKFLVAFLVDDRGVGEDATKFYEKLWKTGEFQSATGALNLLRSS